MKKLLLCGMAAMVLATAPAGLAAGAADITAVPAVEADSPNVPAKADTLYGSNAYGEQLAELARHFKNRDQSLDSLLRDPRFEIYESIGDRFRGSAEKKSRGRNEYKQVLEFDDKTERIAAFMDRHADVLRKAEREYGISPYVIAAIIGIESDFGTKNGRYNPFNSYVSMYVTGYRRSFARAQLEELLAFTERKNLDVFELKSSYAGAVSSAQFIPYSLNKWFVGDDIFDMGNSILSVGNYLAYFLERTGDLRTAVIRYNPSGLYADTVLELAKKAEQNRSDRP